MGIGHIMKLGTKFLVRGIIYKSGKKAAIKGGKLGIGVFSVLYAGYLAYTLHNLRKESIEEQKQLGVDRGWDHKTVHEN